MIEMNGSYSSSVDATQGLEGYLLLDAGGSCPLFPFQVST